MEKSINTLKPNLPYFLWKISNTLYRYRVPILPVFFQYLLRTTLGCVVPHSTKIGENVHFAHLGMGIVIDSHSVIGNNVQINHQVTIGGRKETGYPFIGNNVYIGAGAKILGGIKIGNHAKIGANAVVIMDVPDNATAVGVPAKVIVKK
jgi:serine O-acetyltransferase